jgi:hypothetical protein
VGSNRIDIEVNTTTNQYSATATVTTSTDCRHPIQEVIITVKIIKIIPSVVLFLGLVLLFRKRIETSFPNYYCTVVEYRGASLRT